MEIRVLGCCGSQLPGCGLTSFLIDAHTLLDAGAVTSVLSLADQLEIRNVLVTHPHLDHVGELGFLADNISLAERREPLLVLAPGPVVCSLREHIFNGRIWPDFTAIPTAQEPVLKFVVLEHGRRAAVGPLAVTPILVGHSVPTAAYLIEEQKDGRSAACLFVGDTGPTDEVWQVAARCADLRALFVETSLPVGMEEVAERTGHLTPLSLAGELRKLLPAEPEVYLCHMKVQYRDRIEADVAGLGRSDIHVLRDGQVVRI